MKIQVTQTLPNGQVTQQVLSKDGAEVLKIQAQPGAKISFNVEGVKPADAANAKAKTGNIKKSGNNLVLESEGEALVEVTDFYSTAGASVGDVGWNYAATDAGVMTATPEAQALSSDAAVSESGALFPAIAPGWLVAGGAATVAAVASGGSSSAATVASNIVSGAIVAGPVVAGHGLSVVLYKADGTTLLGTATVDASGKFSLDVGSYTGVIIAKVVDAGVGNDYADEASGRDVDLSAQLMAVGVMTGGTLKLNINPLTAIAAQKAGLLPDGSGSVATATAATEANAAVAKAFGLADVSQTDPDTSNDSVAGVNAIGAVLAALSGLDAQNGNAQTTINNFAAGITQTGAVGVLTAPAQTAALQGAAIADPAGTLGLVNALSDVMSSAVTTTGFTIGDVATDNIIKPADGIATTTTITGTAATGTLLADLDLKIGGVASANNAGFALTGTTWTYTLSAADVTALTTGTDGALVIELTVAGVTKGQRMVLKDMTDDAPSAVTFLNPVASILENAVNTSGTKVADINIADIDGYVGVAPTVSDATNFEVRTVSGKYELWLKSSASIDYETVVGQTLSTTVTAGGTPSQTFTLAIANANEAPTAAGTVTAQTAVNGQAYNFDVHTYFADPDTTAPNNTLTYSATGLPTGVTINSTTGVISGTATADRTASSVVVTATDGGSLSITQSFNLAVVSAPTVSSFTVADTTGTTTLGKSGEALSFVVTLSEAVTTTAGLTAHFSVNGQDVTATSAAVTGANTITFTGASVPGTGNGTAITLTSLVADSGAITGNLSTQPMVVPTAGAVAYAGYTVDNTAPTVSSTTFNVAENATAMTTSGALTANETVTWSLGSGADTALFSLTGGVLSLAAAKNYEVDETTDHAYTVNVVATDAAGNATTQAVTVNLTNVNEIPSVANAIVDTTFVVGGAVDSFVVPANTFADVDAGTTLTYSATLQDGTALPSWLTFTPGTRTFSGNPTSNGTTTVRVTASDGSLSVYDDFVITSVTAPVVQSFTVVDATGTTTKGTSGEALTFAVTFSEAITVTGTLTAHFSVNGADVTATYTGAGGSATLNFTGGTVPATGDGTVVSLTSLTGTAVGNVSGQPMVAPTAAAVTYSGYTVDNTAPTVTAAYSVNENTASDTALHTVSLAGSDTNGPVTFSGLSGTDAAKFTLAGSTLTFAGQTNYEVADDAGANHVYDISVIGTDAVGKTTTQAITITLQDVNETPAAVGTIAAQHAISGTAYTLSTAASFSDVDAGANGTLTYSATGLASGLSINATTGVISGTHTGAVAAGSVVVTATDGGALHVAQTFNMDVVVAPALTATQALDGTTNLSVQSALEISFDQAVSLASGHIHIYDDMGTAGWAHSNIATGESKIDVNKNDVDITLVNGVATAVTIGGVDYSSRFDLAHSVMVGDATHAAGSGLASSGSNLLIDLKPAVASVAGTGVFSTAFDWDFGSNYHVNFDAGIVINSAGVANAALNDGSATATGALQNTTLNFTTVTPVNTVAAAVASVLMDATGATTATTSSYKWLNANQGINDGTAPLTFNLAANSVALVQDTNGGTTKSGSLGQNITVSNFGFETGAFTRDDIIYMDNHGDMSLATTDGLASTSSTWQSGVTRLLSGASTGTNVVAGTPYLTFDLTNSPAALLSSMGTQDTQFEGATKMGYNAVIFG